MIFLFALLSTLSEASRVPVSILQTPVDDSNVLVRASLASIAPGSGPIPVSISLTQENGIVSTRGIDGIEPRFDEVFGLVGEDSTVYNVTIPRVIHLSDQRAGNATGVTSAILGIGHRSALMNTVGSIGLIRSSVEPESQGFLVFNQSEAVFAAENCLDGELRHIPYAMTPFTVSGQGLDAIWQVDVIEPSSGGSTTHGPFGHEADSKLHMTTGRMVGVGFPFGVFSTIHGRISAITRLEGANVDGRYTMHFENCTTVRAALPNIGLNIYNSGALPIGQILFTPSDYTRMVGGDRCRLLATPASGGPEAFEIDPFQLDGMNVRFNRTHFGFCDELYSQGV